MPAALLLRNGADRIMKGLRCNEADIQILCGLPQYVTYVGQSGDSLQSCNKKIIACS